MVNVNMPRDRPMRLYDKCAAPHEDLLRFPKESQHCPTTSLDDFTGQPVVNVGEITQCQHFSVNDIARPAAEWPGAVQL